MKKPKRRVSDFINATIEYERGNSEKHPGGFGHGLDRAEAQLAYKAIRMALTALGTSVEPERKPWSDYEEQKLAGAYDRRGLDSTPLRP